MRRLEFAMNQKASQGDPHSRTQMGPSIDVLGRAL